MRQRQIKLPAIATWVERRAQRREVRKRWGKLQIVGVTEAGAPKKGPGRGFPHIPHEGDA